MRKLATGFVGLSFLFFLSVSALASHNDLKEHITVNDKVFVNGTEVKPGRYTVRYNSESGEMTLSKNSKVVVQVKAAVVTNNEKFDHDALLTRDTSNGPELTGIRLGGQREEIQISQTSANVESIGSISPDAIFDVTEDGYVLVETEEGYILVDMKRF